MISYLDETHADVPAREALLDAAFGARRFAKASERIREGRRPAEGLSLVARDDERLVGTVRLWHVAAGRNGGSALLLGPLAVAEEVRGEGVGAALMRLSIARAREIGHRAIVLVGDEPYYRRFGFSAARTAGLAMPGPFERHRLLALELAPDALRGATGLILPTGERIAVAAAKVAA
jgi:predicted N-acetyltransferase YhbS